MKMERVLILCLILIFKVNGRDLFPESRETMDPVKHVVTHKLNQSFEFEDSINSTLTDADLCNCKNGGTCKRIENKFKCICPPGLAGEDCSLKDVCYKKSRCHNNGICKTKGINTYYCICPKPFRGLNCTDFCDRISCNFHGTCVEPQNSDKCICDQGYYGDHCEFKDGCYGTQFCQNGGTCISPASNRYRCICTPGFTGVNCEGEVCNPNPCLNDGICQINGTKFMCECKEPYQGNICDKNTDFNETTAEPTETNTKEITYESTTEDTKEITYESTTEEDTKEITYESTTEDTVEITHESTTTGCYCGHNSIDCYFDKNDRKICYCKRGYAQKNEICVETCADNSECLNGGVCSIQQGRYGFCECKMNFGGDKCEINFLCAELEPTCKHIGAMCAYKNGSASCVCPPHKVYELNSGICKDICDEKSCINGQCVISKSSFICRCNEGYTGLKCDVKMSQNNYLLVIIFVLLAFILISFIIGSISFTWLLGRLRTKSENQLERIS